RFRFIISILATETDDRTQSHTTRSRERTRNGRRDGRGPGPRAGRRATARALDPPARERVECILRHLRDGRCPPPGLYRLVQLRGRDPHFLALEDRRIDRLAVGAGRDRRVLLYREWTSLG